MHTDILTEEEIKFLTVLKGIVEANPGKGYDFTESNNRPDGITVACTYVNWRDAPIIDGVRTPDKASCLFGRVFVTGGYRTIDNLIGWEGDDAMPILEGIQGLSYSFCQAMVSIQGDQDNGNPWDKAYNDGLEYLSGHHRYDIPADYFVNVED